MQESQHSLAKLDIQSPAQLKDGWEEPNACEIPQCSSLVEPSEAKAKAKPADAAAKSPSKRPAPIDVNAAECVQQVSGGPNGIEDPKEVPAPTAPSPDDNPAVAKDSAHTGGPHLQLPSHGEVQYTSESSRDKQIRCVDLPLSPIHEAPSVVTSDTKNNGAVIGAFLDDGGAAGHTGSRLSSIMWLLTVALAIGTFVLELVGLTDRVPVQIVSLLTAFAAVSLGITSRFSNCTQPLRTSRRGEGNEQQQAPVHAIQVWRRQDSNASKNSSGGARKSIDRTGTNMSNMSATSFSDFNRKQKQKLRKLNSQSKTQEELSDILSSLSSGAGAGEAPIITVEFDLANARLEGPQDRQPSAYDSVAVEKVYPAFCDVMMGGGQSEKASADIIKLANSSPGQNRMRVEFRSQCLRTQNAWQSNLLKQSALLDAVSMELADAHQALALRDEARAAQQELLRGFRKIITRESPDQVNAEDAVKVIFVFEESAQLRTELIELCGMLDYECRPFDNLHEGMKEFRQMVISEAPKTPRKTTIHAKDPKKRWKAVIQANKPGARFGTAVLSAARAAKERERLVRIILFGASILSQIPPDWDIENAFAALASQPDEFEQVGLSLLASGENEVREKLRTKWNINEYLLYPLSLDALRGLVDSAVRHHFADEYLLMDQIGRGSFGIVHRVKRLRDLSLFALKEISSRRMNRKDKDAIGTEIELLRELKWPTVLFLVDAWTNDRDRIYYLLMPLLEGGDVDEHLQKNPLLRNDALMRQTINWYSQSVHGLTYLHWSGIVHRDLKPANLVLSADGVRLRIADFGSAMRLPGKGPHPSRKAKIEAQLTTKEYASPESHDGTFFAASDVYSLGKTFEEIADPLTRGDPVEAVCTNAAKEKAPSKEFPSEAKFSEAAKQSKELPNPAEFASQGASEAEFSEHKEESPVFITLQEFLAEQVEACNQDPSSRPTAAVLMRRRFCWTSIRGSLRGDYADSAMLDAHLRELRRVVRDSEEASKIGTTPAKGKTDQASKIVAALANRKPEEASKTEVSAAKFQSNISEL